ncbi:MAG TPA: hypothetical protein VJ249_11200 [Candidatus Bathyarchaeia archaeon]|nr:hypothetical protein [Candidatus Bathyarchaeia archaeon]
MKPKIVAALITLMFIVGMLPIALSPRANAHTAANPFITDLIANQTIDAGDVLVWNDGINLFVRYVTTGSWMMTSTHLAVGDSLSDIPRTKQGSPIPGQFPFSTIHDPPVSMFTYTISLGSWTPGTVLVIAAHAVVCGPAGDQAFAEGLLATMPLYTYPDAENAGSVSVAIVGDNLVITIQTTGSWQLLDTFAFVGFSAPPFPPPWWTWPDRHTGLGGVTTDTYTFSLTGMGVNCGDVLFISVRTWMRGVDSFGNTVLRDGWADPNPFDGWTKFFSVTVPCRLVCETAWGNGVRFTSRNWAMYFNYAVQ